MFLYRTSCQASNRRLNQTLPPRFLCRETMSSTPTWIAPVHNNWVPLTIIVTTSRVRKTESVQLMSISLHANPMDRRVSDNDAREDAYAACKFGAFQRETLCSPVIEEVKPTTPARRERMMKKPVAKFPIGKYIGNMRAGIVKIAAASRDLTIP